MDTEYKVSYSYKMPDPQRWIPKEERLRIQSKAEHVPLKFHNEIHQTKTPKKLTSARDS